MIKFIRKLISKKESRSRKVSATEAYLLAEPNLCNHVWESINSAIECGSVYAYVDGNTGKVPLSLIKELMALGYSIEVKDYNFNISPSLSIYFNKNARSELLLETGDGLHSETRPLSFKEYEELGRRN